jgi:hypothetical protein
MLYLNCPACGLTVLPRAAWLTIDHCPRCIVRRRTRVPMLTCAAPPGVRAATSPMSDAMPASPSVVAGASDG